MFKRSKTKLTPPAPPSLDEIFEDLQTFKLEKSSTIPQPVRTLSAESDDIAEWWKLFRTFQYDVVELKALHAKLKAVRKELDTENKELKVKTDTILMEIEEALGKVANEIPNQNE